MKRGCSVSSHRVDLRHQQGRKRLVSIRDVRIRLQLPQLRRSVMFHELKGNDGMERLLCTIVIGSEAEEISKHSIPLMQDYAARCKCDFKVLRASDISSEYGNAFYEKLQLAKELETYKRVLYVDADIIILPTARNLFSIVPDGLLGVSIIDNPGLAEKERLAIEKIYDFQIDKKTYFNAGVILTSRVNKPLFEPNPALVKRLVSLKNAGEVKALNDQCLLNYYAQEQNVPLFDIGKAFNFTRAWRSFGKRFQHDFIHYAGMSGQRTRLMRLDSSIAGKTIVFRVLRWIPVLSWMRDKLVATTN